MANVLLDNDVIFKLSCYGLHEELENFLNDRGGIPGVLTVALFVLTRHLKRSQRIADRTRAKAKFRRIVLMCQRIEPTPDEIAVALSLEEQAQVEGLQLDAGESQLLAILVSRQVPLLLTGDKRAIAAIERLRIAEDAQGRLACLEQLFHCFLDSENKQDIRDAICRESQVDKSLAICFSCGSGTASRSSIYEGLRSYIKAIRRSSPRVLANDDLRLIPVP